MTGMHNIKTLSESELVKLQVSEIEAGRLGIQLGGRTALSLNRIR